MRLDGYIRRLLRVAGALDATGDRGPETLRQLVARYRQEASDAVRESLISYDPALAASTPSVRGGDAAVLAVLDHLLTRIAYSPPPCEYPHITADYLHELRAEIYRQRRH